MLEHLLLDVGNFSEQLVYQLDGETQERLIERYYGLDDAFCREVVGKKLRQVMSCIFSHYLCEPWLSLMLPPTRAQSRPVAVL